MRASVGAPFFAWLQPIPKDDVVGVVGSESISRAISPANILPSSTCQAPTSASRLRSPLMSKFQMRWNFGILAAHTSLLCMRVVLRAFSCLRFSFESALREVIMCNSQLIFIDQDEAILLVVTAGGEVVISGLPGYSGNCGRRLFFLFQLTFVYSSISDLSFAVGQSHQSTGFL